MCVVSVGHTAQRSAPVCLACNSCLPACVHGVEMNIADTTAMVHFQLWSLMQAKVESARAADYHERFPLSEQGQLQCSKQ